MFLRNNLKLARVGDFIVTSQNKTYTVLLIDQVSAQEMALEEITVPTKNIPLSNFSWKNWIEQNAPGHTSWVRYVINTSTGQMKEYFSYTKNGWYTLTEGDNFLSTLLNLKLSKVSVTERKKVGPRPPPGATDKRPYWQPKLIFEGKVIPGVMFDSWRTFWPKDGSELSGKIIEVFVPQNPGAYPAYFPYWLQVSGIVGKAKVHIIDSGRGVYPSRAQPSNSDDAKAPGLNDRKLVHISNIDQLAIVQPRELSHCQNSKVEPGWGIKGKGV